MTGGVFYHEFYGLRHRPFALTPDPDFLHLTDAHREALERRWVGLQEGLGFLVLTGEVGTGKTTLVHALLTRLTTRWKTAYLINSLLDFPEILASILEDLGVVPASTRKTDLLRQLNVLLLQEHAAGCEVLIVIDEAQNLSPALLEEVRLLSNLETPGAKLVHLLLVGQPELDALLDAPQLRQLRQRVGVRVALRPLTRPETGGYITHRLRIAGPNSECRFTPAAVDQVYGESCGIPRLINKICHGALIAGYVARTSVITPPLVNRAIHELVVREVSLGPVPSAGRVRRFMRHLVGATLLLLLIALLGLGLIFLPEGAP
jgi:general secretion pathway protein A